MSDFKPFLGEYAGIEIRDYQQKLIDDIRNAFGSGHRRIMSQLATGAGKTVVFAYISGYAVAKGKRVLILAHTEELVFQASEKLSTLTPYSVGIVKAGHKPDYTCPIQVASVLTMVNRLPFHEHFDLIIIDEAHHAPAPTYRKIVENYPAAKVLGMTATVWRLDKKGFDSDFDTLVQGPSTSWLIDKGYLCDYRIFVPSYSIKTKGLTSNTAGDYSAHEIELLNDMEKVKLGVMENYRQHAYGKQGIVFAYSVELSQQVAALYTLSGIPAVHLDADTPKGERQKAMEKFKRKEIGVICNYGLFTEGLDVPGLDFVQVLRPTESLNLWLQICGRVLRPHQDKDFALILDHTDNWSKHGVPTLDRPWTLLPPEVKEKGESAGGNRPTKPEDKQEYDLAGNELKELTLHETQDHWDEQLRLLLITEEKRGYKTGWVKHQLIRLKAPLRTWQKYAEHRGFKKGWGWYQYQQQEGLQETPPQLDLFSQHPDNNQIAS